MIMLVITTPPENVKNICDISYEFMFLPLSSNILLQILIEKPYICLPQRLTRHVNELTTVL